MTNQQLHEAVRRGQIRRLLAYRFSDPERVDATLLYRLDDLPVRLPQQERRALQSSGVGQKLSALQRQERDQRMIARLHGLRAVYEDRVAVPMDVAPITTPKRGRQQQPPPTRRIRFRKDLVSGFGSMKRPDTAEAEQTRRQLRQRLQRISRQIGRSDRTSRFAMTLRRSTTHSDRSYIAAAEGVRLDTLDLPEGLEIIRGTNVLLSERVGYRRILFHVFPNGSTGRSWPPEAGVSSLMAFTFSSNGRYLVPVNRSTWVDLNPTGFTIVRNHVEDHHLDVFHRLV
jgi:hypothetical protein